MTEHDVAMPGDGRLPDASQEDTQDTHFDSLGLHDDLIACLTRRGINEPFPIQLATIPDALAGRDVLGRGRTGSGKTLAFGLPLLSRLEGRRARRGRPLALVLVPTRELAMQVHDALAPFAQSVGLRAKAVFGGVPLHKQILALRRGVDLLVATPGRLMDLVERQECQLDDVRIAVLDEADQMADMGFLPIVSEILDLVPADGQRLLFSATLDRGVDALVAKYLTDPVTHSVDPVGGSVDTMSHHLLVVAPQHKVAVTAQIAARRGRTIAFARTKLGVDRIVDQLRDAGVRAAGLHGSKTQAARTRILAEFREGSVPVLVATDVAARGIHVDDVDLVLHVDPAADSKDYLHRAGRTARAGESGTVATLVLPHQRRSVGRLMEAAGVSAEELRVRPGDAGLVAVTGARPDAIRDTGPSNGYGPDESTDEPVRFQNRRAPTRPRPESDGRPRTGGPRTRPAPARDDSWRTDRDDASRQQAPRDRDGWTARPSRYQARDSQSQESQHRESQHRESPYQRSQHQGRDEWRRPASPGRPARDDRRQRPEGPGVRTADRDGSGVPRSDRPFRTGTRVRDESAREWRPRTRPDGRADNRSGGTEPRTWDQRREADRYARGSRSDAPADRDSATRDRDRDRSGGRPDRSRAPRRTPPGGRPAPDARHRDRTDPDHD